MNWTRSAAAAAAAVSLAAGFASAANATQFVGTFDVTPNTDPGLVIATNPDNGSINGAGGFNVTVGSPFVVSDLFTIYTTEDFINSDDTVPDTISVAFNFTTPGGAGTLEGSTFAIDGGFLSSNRGHVTWDNPLLVNFGNGGVLQITLHDADFNQVNTPFDLFNLNHTLNSGQAYGADIQATFTLLHDSAGGVPEPASWALMIGGFGMAGATLRRRRATVAAAA